MNRNFLIPYTVNNENQIIYSKEINKLININDAIGFNDYTYIISVNDNIINIYSYLNQYNYDETIYLNLENSYNGIYNYVCSGKIDNFINYDYKTKSKRIYALFKNSLNQYLLYYNDEFKELINNDNEEIKYLDKVNYGINLGFTKIKNGVSYLFYIDGNILKSIKIKDLFNDINLIINSGKLNYKCYCYKNNDWEEILINNNLFQLSLINEFTYCCDKINNEIVEYFNIVIKIIELNDYNEILNIQRLIYHIIKINNNIKYCYNYYFGYDKDNQNKIYLTNLIFNNCLMTVDNLNNNSYIIQFINSFDNININYLNLNSELMNKNFYDELQRRKTLNNGLNKYVII